MLARLVKSGWIKRLNGFGINMFQFLNTKHRKLQGQKAFVVTPSERSLQEWAAQYFKTVLIDAKYEGHESSIGLGIMRVKPNDSATTRSCKVFYNKFVMAAQKKFQAKGVSKGSSDGFLFYKGGVICLEFKIGNNKPRDEQEAFAKEMLTIGYPTLVPRTQEDVMAIPGLYGIKTRVVGG